MVCEFPRTSQGVYYNQITHECNPLLEYVHGVLDETQVSDDVDRVDHDIRDHSLSMLCDESLIVSFAHINYVIKYVGQRDRSEPVRLPFCKEDPIGCLAYRDDYVF